MSIQDLHQELDRSVQPAQAENVEVKKIPCCWILTIDGVEQKIKLNDSSMLIWQLCDGQNTVGEIIDNLQEQYPDVESMDKDIQRALDELLEEKLISV